MAKKMRLITLILCLVFLITFVFAASINLVDLHLNASKVPMSQCVKCHTDRTKGKSLDSKIFPAHKLHMIQGTFKCQDCHKIVDLRETSGAYIRKQVSPNVCLKCHDQFFIKK
ncbi:MAG: cytochrome c3 family protein [Armatimonadetes bacterium]|nr:cytochrome c3 family protein [Armatimonadota bacterium]